MIYTCTLNPSLDYYMEFDKEIQLHQTNRSAIDYFDAGGKGINVSIVLSNLGVPSKALGFVGGFTKEFYVTLLERHTYLQPNFTYTEGITRINVKAVQGLTTELNAAGPNIDVQAQEAFLKRVARVGEEDIFVLSGNVQTALQDFIEEIIKDLASKGTKIVLDTDPTMLKR
ncbi:MAG: PfkB family carbohydrate kinase, partial [Erysipelotrichaceae bacterium]